MTTDNRRQTINKDQALRIAVQQRVVHAEKMTLSEGFTDRLMQRIGREEKARKVALRRHRTWVAVGMAAALALLLGIAIHLFQGDEKVPQTAAVKKEPKGQQPADGGQLIVERGELRVEREELVANVPVPISKVMEEEKVEDVKLRNESLELRDDDDAKDVCWIVIPNTPFALKYSLTWESAALDEAIANVSSVECVTIEENDTVLIKSPSGEISRGSMYVYEGEKKENDFVYMQDGRLLTADVRIYYKKAFLNADGQTYSYMDALALLDYPTCSLCMKD